MPIIHIVSLKYKDAVSTSQRQDLFNQLNNFPHQCLYNDGKPYIVDFKSSTQNISPEGAGKGFHHTFVSTFPSKDHMKWYLEHDRVHLDFVDKVKPALDDLYIYDFEA
ncbi:uncharacterized protein UTRI_06270 [Ustilago trichophora]|uniref:Stress-response A/B barrel domain-containing protein n=1 Tax=Ustilago trichophora TaxID=86804 RepID=A0A5C3EII8_9BASI|nr:uncharacterized protein UTRI_06270 [Ustilago trichophora]